MANITISQGLLLVVTQSNKKLWYRITRRKASSVEQYFSSVPDFKYAKCYEFDRKTRQTGKQLGYFGVKETGEWYAHWY
jgi:hypothetical protein